MAYDSDIRSIYAKATAEKHINADIILIGGMAKPDKKNVLYSLVKYILLSILLKRIIHIDRIPFSKMLSNFPKIAKIYVSSLFIYLFLNTVIHLLIY